MIRVEGDALATAAMPLVIDPVVTDVNINTTFENDQAPDIAWDPIEGVWMAVYSDIFSATDADVFVQMILPSGALSGGAFIDQRGVPGLPRMRPRVSAVFLSRLRSPRTPTTPRPDVSPTGPSSPGRIRRRLPGLRGREEIRPDVGGDPPRIRAPRCVFSRGFRRPRRSRSRATRVARGGRSSTMSTYRNRRRPTRQPTHLDLEIERRRRLVVAWQRGPDLQRNASRAAHPRDGTGA